MSKHKLISIILIILLIFPSVAIAAGKPAASISSDTDEYILVRKDVFNALVTNDKLVNLYKSENDRYKNVISNLEDAYNSKDINTNKQIETLKQIISNDNEIIVTKDNNIKNYEKIYNNEKTNTKIYQKQTLLYKILFATAAGFAISNIDSTALKITAGVGAAALTFINIRF
jgi:hypothetical protein